ncbi:hypothetical protein [Nocardioides lacusdianchii]|uniref:hypothetical protein n=1 Tax=Nocardioides lacusdianchii TaxID=2783664 RepID=UPI001CCB0243|nr:hypothetical protein [Nocardioides lacusdianchii]
MDHAPPPPAPATVRVVVEDVCDLEERVSAAARRARECHRAVELVEPFVAECDHAGRAGLIRRMDVALAVARRAAPGVEIRVGGAIELPRPRDPR